MDISFCMNVELTSQLLRNQEEVVVSVWLFEKYLCTPNCNVQEAEKKVVTVIEEVEMWQEETWEIIRLLENTKTTTLQVGLCLL